MNAIRSSIASLFVITVILLVTTPVMVVCAVPNDELTQIQVRLSSVEVQPEQKLIINVTFNTTQPYYYRLGRVIISCLSTGYIVNTGYFNLTSNQNLFIPYPGQVYKLYGEYEWTPKRPIMFGEYTIWVTVGNISAFNEINVVPSLVDLYGDLAAMQHKYDESMNNYWYVIRIIYPAAFLLSAMTIMVCYYIWRLPDSNKQELKYWLLSKVDIKKLERLKAELRDIDRKAFNSRNAPSVGKNEKEISALRKKKKILENLKLYTDKRIEKLKKYGDNAGEFSDSLAEAIKVIDEEISTRNANIEKALNALQVKAQKTNRKFKPENAERRIPHMDLDRLRRMARRRIEGEE